MKVALITGITGQDGAYLAKLLVEKDYKVFGLYRRTSSPNIWRLLSLGINNKVNLIPGDMTDMASINNAIIQSEPDEIYNLAAQSFVGTSFEQPLATAMVDGLGVVGILESVKQMKRKIKVYHASTSELFGNGRGNIWGNKEALNEEDIFWPMSPYAAAKLYSYHTIRMYKEAYGIFAVNGVLFNHESPLRGLEFVTRKITNSIARIKLGLQKQVVLGNLEAKRDWGYAPEYVEAIWLMLQQDEPDDFVIATGESHSVREFLEIACHYASLESEKIVCQSDRFKRPLDINYLCGDGSKAKRILGWTAMTKFEELVELMVEEDLKRWTNHLKGEIFPWDAINDPGVY